jgi:hypothetical protein
VALAPSTAPLRVAPAQGRRARPAAVSMATASRPLSPSTNSSSHAAPRRAAPACRRRCPCPTAQPRPPGRDEDGPGEQSLAASVRSQHLGPDVCSASGTSQHTWSIHDGFLAVGAFDRHEGDRSSGPPSGRPTPSAGRPPPQGQVHGGPAGVGRHLRRRHVLAGLGVQPVGRPAGMSAPEVITVALDVGALQGERAVPLDDQQPRALRQRVVRGQDPVEHAYPQVRPGAGGVRRVGGPLSARRGCPRC